MLRLPPSAARHPRIWRVALVWCALHLLALAGVTLFMPEFTRSEVRSWSDLGAYLDAADAVRDHQPLYELTTWDDVMTYYYHPAFAAVFVLVSWLPFRLLGLLWMVSQIAAYLAALAVWYRVITALGQDREGYIRWLPLALVFTEWYVNLAFGNLTSTLLLLSGLLMLALIRQHPGWASLIALPVLLVKPQWLFPLILPVVFRQWKLLLRVLAGLAVLYALTTGLYVLVVGADYGLDSLHDYAHFFSRMGEDFPWEIHTGAFGNMNHSWRQIFLSYAGDQGWVPTVARLAQFSLWVPLLLMLLWAWRRQVTLDQQPLLALTFAGLGYLAAMATLTQLWEVLGSIVFFIVIQSIASPALRRVSRLYLIYALYEIPALVGFLIGWDGLVLPQSIPLTMLALIVLYACLIVLTYRAIPARTVDTKEMIYEPGTTSV